MSNILLGVTGSVAATLTPKIATALAEVGEVNIVATEAALYFFDSAPCRVWTDKDEWWGGLSGKEKKWKQKGDPVVHIELRDWADVIVLAPLTANTMAKICAGICDNLLTSVLRAWDCKTPVVFAPSMNTFMWERGLTTDQAFQLRQWGWHYVCPISKELACGDEGEGAMARIEDIVSKVEQAVKRNN